MPSQLDGAGGGARIGATLHKRAAPRRWWAFVRNAKRVRIGDRIDFGSGVAAIVEARDEAGEVLLAFEGDEHVELHLERAGRRPRRTYTGGNRHDDEQS